LADKNISDKKYFCDKLFQNNFSPSNEIEGLGTLLTADSDLDMTGFIVNVINESTLIQINVVNVALGTKIVLDLVAHGKSNWVGVQNIVTKILSIYPDFKGEGLRLWGRIEDQKIIPLDMVRKKFYIR
jgi:hypothetical protein